MKVTLVAGYGAYYRPCCICARGFETGNTIAVAHSGHNWLGYVCLDCMKGGSATMKATLRRRGEELLELANGEIDCPQPEECVT